MTRPTVHLVERRARRVRVPRGDVEFLRANARHLVDVEPAFRRGVYRLTPRGCVGWFDTPTLRIAVAPKVPWPTVRMLLGLPHAAHGSGSEIDPAAGLLDSLAREFTALLRATQPVAGYHDRDSVSPYLRGKFRVGDQLRDAAARAFPDRFHVTESVLDLDTPWNRVPRVVADALLANPALAPNTRIELRDAALSLAGVSAAPVTDADFAAADADPRATHYRPLLGLCRTISDGFAAARLPGAGRGAFLVDLSRAFEGWLARGLTDALAPWPGWSVEERPTFPVGPTVLQPDLVVRHHRTARVVLDAKWKAPGAAPDAGDLHQVLAYSVATGARHVALVYPGRRFARRTFAVPGSDVAVSLVRVCVVGTGQECHRSLAGLGRTCRDSHRPRGP
ncbi:5-methylcytosine restriction system component-like protein OS=Micromonospora aurantiaca (strain ATCC 27029 / DSM 43813 / JCM 10878 / NBRC 16125 / INA 9442) GN=Micau_1865 PE=4 SV=1: McrBC [Gemmataceae bacterium]|nr:5-methylcytosine restriction system component-like protein OS=Micromonospora aurantiaca (strain ATCC 27029 / DSM 43813 / JCM 10878 / NBRC 16125 / INA 9442) GN=Micau_1865 PE=4 SV=1: McrBC [Gemmataceae bacterium]VTT96599.1 5-methylcytosine restriction system component-like protein OS=Micromonospora aurantiaca (strain ATCC 27029 / DSM 43813 / JCM 10878 / NBRC 16125 / INA 9442) GN=Micau_1865 PE=4 SV=1: McrBC [Gemmataceae bacterium]